MFEMSAQPLMPVAITPTAIKLAADTIAMRNDARQIGNSLGDVAMSSAHPAGCPS